MLICGCISLPGSGQVPVPDGTGTATTVATTVPTTISVNETPTLNPAPNITTIPVPDTTAPTPAATLVIPTPLPTYNNEEIRAHFIDSAFGPRSGKLFRWQTELVDVSISGMFHDSDKKVINNLAWIFNELSTTTRMVGEVEVDRSAHIMVNFVPENSIRQLKSEDTLSSVSEPGTGIIGYMILPGAGTGDVVIYMNSELVGDVRDHLLLRSVLYGLGFYGESLKYRDSIFFRQGYTTTHMSGIDESALKLMYGGRIRSGMSVEEVRRAL